MTVLLINASCKTHSEAEEKESNLSFSERIKLRQYMVQGEQLYKLHCANCHSADGSGLAKLIPPLVRSKNLNANPSKIICGIRNGMAGPMVINGISFDSQMPPNYKLTYLEIAEIITYVGNSWGNSTGIITSDIVANNLSNCRLKN
ncbi:MAG: cytochrome c [Cyclobacteriaceae bacterium]